MINYSEKNLKKKIEYLLYKSRYSKRSRLAENFIDPIMNIGNVVLFGGAARDMLFESTRKFNSDLDFVIEVKDQKLFSEFLKKWAPEKNSYGGYRLIIGSNKIDFWQLKDSWVKINSSLKLESLEDLVDTTFFNLDAIIYDLNNRKIHKGSSFSEGIKKQILDINYAENSNLDSIAVKALRRLWTHDLRASDELVLFLKNQIDKSGWKALVNRDNLAYPHYQLLNTFSQKEKLTSCDFDHLLTPSKKINREMQPAFPI